MTCDRCGKAADLGRKMVPNLDRERRVPSCFLLCGRCHTEYLRAGLDARERAHLEWQVRNLRRGT